MKSDDIEAEVILLQKQCDVLMDQLDRLVQRFQDKLPSLAEPWIRHQVEYRIEDNPEKVAALGLDKLKSLKVKLNSLIASLADIVKTETSDRNDWPHYRPRDSRGYGRDEHFFQKAFRNVISYIGTLLDEYGLLKEPKDLSWEKTAPGKYRFAINPGFDFMSMPLFKEYEQKYKEYGGIKSELKRKQIELAKTKAREMWESA
jgi:hypothetical protein